MANYKRCMNLRHEDAKSYTSSGSTFSFGAAEHPTLREVYASISPSSSAVQMELDDIEKKLKHLLEASDEELGIPKREQVTIMDYRLNCFSEVADISVYDYLW